MTIRRFSDFQEFAAAQQDLEHAKARAEELRALPIPIDQEGRRRRQQEEDAARRGVDGAWRALQMARLNCCKAIADEARPEYQRLAKRVATAAVELAEAAEAATAFRAGLGGIDPDILHDLPDVGFRELGSPANPLSQLNHGLRRLAVAELLAADDPVLAKTAAFKTALAPARPR
jgi:hypothetical protein